MFASERQRLIAAEVAERGRRSVQELVAEHGVTAETVRRDLDQLESQGRLRRVHGGAVAIDHHSLAEHDLADRAGRQGLQKARIAELALDQLPMPLSGSILLDAGTTTELIALRLAERLGEGGGGEGLVVITNSLPIATLLAANESLRIIVIGGIARGRTGAMVGPEMEDQLSRLQPDLAFLGTNGLHGELGLSTPDALEAGAKRAMIRSARRTTVVADAAKHGQTALHSFARLAEVDALLTDAAPPADLAEALAEAGVEVQIAGPGVAS